MSALVCGHCGRQHSVAGLAAGTQLACPCGHTLRLLSDLSQTPSPPLSLDATHVPSANPSGAPSGSGPAPVPAARPPSSGAGAISPGLDATVVRVERQPKLPGYELLELYGRGGMGEVWRGRQISLGRTVAIKLLPDALAADPEFVARFDKEATALATLSHPNIVQIIDRGREGQTYFFVMELVEGGSLRERAQGERLSVGEILSLVIQIARALDAAHEKGVVHRDLKPENVLLDGRSHVKVADFGLAGFKGDRARSVQLTASRVAMGTLNYMAPEQRREARSVDGRADLYSLGVILYELLTGDLPIGRFAPVQKRLPDIDPGFDEVLGHLLENDPEARYPTASALLADLEILQSRLSSTQSAAGAAARSGGASGTGPVLGRLTTQPPPSAPRPWSKRLLLGGALALLLGLGAYALRPGAAGAPTPKGPGDEVETPVAGPRPGAVTPPNTDDALWVKATRVPLEDGRAQLTLDFEDGDEEMSGYEGSWRIEEGQLRVEQAGNLASREGAALRPRAYLSTRYFGADDFSAKIQVELKELSAPYAPDPVSNRFMELSFRVTGVQVSVLAIPDSGLRLQWNYLTLGGRQLTGSSQEAIDQMIADVYPVPKGRFELRLSLEKTEGGVRATGWVRSLEPGARPREVPFATALLPELEGRVAKLALGCRNLACRFSEVQLEGIERERGSDRVAEAP